jgi:hypothetical protein
MTEVLVDNKYILIGGALKAGTTSLYEYLNDHPDICGSNVKETYFFLDYDYYYPKKRYITYMDGIDKYDDFFRNCKNQKYRMEATPTYLYSLGTPTRIRNSLTHVIWIFLIREPISRLISLYRFSKQLGLIGTKETFTEFVDKRFEFNDEHGIGRRNFVTSRYSIYLPRFMRLFPNDDILIINFDELRHKPLEVMRFISQKLDINENFYFNYKFHNYNPTFSINNKILHFIYSKISSIHLQMKFYKYPNLVRIFKYSRSIIENVYLNLNRNEVSDIDIPNDILKKLSDYYSSEKSSLSKILSIEDFDWDFKSK